MGWISIEQQKPPNGYTIVSYKHPDDPRIVCSGLCVHIDGVFTSMVLRREVTHWLPLTSPPQPS